MLMQGTERQTCDRMSGLAVVTEMAAFVPSRIAGNRLRATDRHDLIHHGRAAYEAHAFAGVFDPLHLRTLRVRRAADRHM